MNAKLPFYQDIVVDRQGKQWRVGDAGTDRIHLIPAPVEGEPTYFGTDPDTGLKTEFAVGNDRSVTRDRFERLYKAVA